MRLPRLLRRTVAVGALEPVIGPLARLRHVAGVLVAAAVVLAAVGGRAGRRAAARGLVSATASALLVNGFKSLLGWPRPTPNIRSRLVSRTRSRTPWSFPSSHAASTAAFAVGAGMELRWSAAPLAAGAAAIGYSRVYGRQHRPVDVAVGAASGAAIAVATRRWWPVAPPAGGAAPARTHASVEVGPRGAGLVIVANAGAGLALAPSPAGGLEDDLPDATLVEVSDADEFEATLRRAVDGARAIGVVGGDGTVNAGAAVAHERGLPLLVVPGGTLNHFARDLGVEEPSDAVAAVKAGSVVEVDVGCIDGRPFLNTASLGSYVDLVDARERLEGRLGKWPAVVVALVHVLRNAEPIDIELDGRRRTVWMVFVGNGRYHPQGFAPSWRERLDDGLLDVRVVDAASPWCRLRLIAAVLTGTLARSRVYETWTAERVEVRTHDGPIRAARDGETFQAGETFEITKLPQRLLVFAPEKE